MRRAIFLFKKEEEEKEEKKNLALSQAQSGDERLEKETESALQS